VTAGTPAPAPASGGERYAFRASSAQERLVYLDLAVPGLPTYNEGMAFRLGGPLDVAALQRALHLLRARHEALRTTLDSPGGVARQVVAAEAEWLLEVDHGDSERIDAWLRGRAGAPFDLARGPLVRAALLVIAPEDHVLYLGAHHAICDGVSLDILARELAGAYSRLARGEPHGLPDAGVQYPDFALWQREQLEAGAYDEQLAFWARRLAGLHQPIALPFDRPRPAMQSLLGGQVMVRMPLDEVAAVDALARACRTTRFNVLLAGYTALLARLARTDDVAVGVPVATRDEEGTEDAVGFYANVVVYRTRVALDRPFSELLESVRATAVEALAHRDAPFDRVVEAVNPPHSDSYNPLFQVLFSLADDPATTFRLDGVASERLLVESGGSRVDQWFSLLQGDDGIAVHVEYDGALFDRETALRMAGQFRTILRAACAAPATAVERLPLLTPEERRVLTEDWARGRQDPSPAPLLLEAVRARAMREPEAVAVEVLPGGRLVTCAELMDRATAISAALRAAGVQPGDVVGVMATRDAWLVPALLGVHGARAVYLPLDPTLPEARLRTMLDLAGAHVVLASSDARAERVVGAEPLVRLEDVAPSTQPMLEPQPDDLAYVIFTSGSTGTPKGVEVPQAALANFLASMAHEPGFAPGARLLAITTIGFDIAGLELFLPLVAGGTVVLADRETARDGRALAAALGERCIDVLQATPATWRLLLDGGWPGDPALKALVGGEAVTPDLAAALAARTAEAWNVYGPTETTIWSTIHRMRADDAFVSIGRPIDHTTVYVVSADGEPSPVGVPGEIVIGGRGVARGYRGRPELTAERFAPDPFDAARGPVYRTGDVGRWRADGRLEHLGRSDDQVKLRGFRVELGEVEAALAAHPDVAAAAVSVRRDRMGQASLVAYVVPRDNATVTSTDARRFLAKRLPDYMLPAHLVTLDRLPLTASGKVDRRALPDPLGAAAATAARVHRPPTRPTELLLAELWRDVIGAVTPGLDDTFFDMGGHSLGAMRVLAEFERRTGRRLPLRLIVRENLENLAAAAESAADT
jgi:amino acid adenylation domain-containing protein